MTKKKKGKKTAKPVAKKAAKETKAEVEEKAGSEVLKDLAKMVKVDAPKMTQAVILQGISGQLPTVKFLLEMAGIFPKPAAEESVPTKDEDCLAETLLDRLGIPKTPIVADQYAKEDEVIVGHPAKELSSEEEEEESSQLSVVSGQ